MQTKEHKRSQFALEQIKKEFDDSVVKDTANFIVGMPTMILTNGIGQSLAFLLSKKGEDSESEEKLKYDKVFRIIQSWLQTEIDELKTDNKKEFLEKMAGLDQGVYLKAQREALAILQWLKRYARAFQQ
jgi:CRISPR-associated protein Cmr5